MGTEGDSVALVAKIEYAGANEEFFRKAAATLSRVGELGNILLVANWLAERGVVDWARGIRSEYLTGTAITIIVVLLILLVSPRAGTLVRRRPVCDHVLLSRGKYCGECGSKVS